MQNLLQDLRNLLAQDIRLLTPDGVLLRNLTIELGLKLDPDLLRLLLSHDRIKRHFFVEVDGILVFDKDKFLHFVNHKEFLPDSYTAFKNKIGLSDDGGETYLSRRRDVTLVWPYKDCVLEGGQTQEDARRDEIFWNTTLAPDDIDRLLDPKVLTNFRRIDAQGDRPAADLRPDDNLIIKGNNLLALHSLERRFGGKVKLIYIDPPYNTGGAANTFSYNNTFNHSTWLTFMKNRLEIGKALLAENGVICIAIDDEEFAHLKVICDNVFGRENYIGTIVIQSNPRGRTINSHFATCHEYALFYAKNISNVEVNDQPLTPEQEREFGQVDDTGKYRWLPFRRSGGTSTPEERPNSEFSLLYSKKDHRIIAVGGERVHDYSQPYEPSEILTLDQNNELLAHDPETFFRSHSASIVEILPIDILGKRRVWRWSDRRAILLAAQSSDFMVDDNEGSYSVKLKDRIKEGRKPKTIWTDSKYDASANGTILLKNLFGGEKLFSYPKSLFTVKDILQMLTNPDENDIVLDFFAGSGTTAHAVLDLNEEEGGNRTFVLCEQMGYIDSVTIRRLKKVIEDYGAGDFVYCELMQWNERYVRRIEAATTTEELHAVWQEMQTQAFLSYRVDVAAINAHAEDFAALSLAEQQRFLLETLDHNALYVNYSEIDDADYTVAPEDKRLTAQFYGTLE